MSEKNSTAPKSNAELLAQAQLVKAQQDALAAKVTTDTKVAAAQLATFRSQFGQAEKNTVEAGTVTAKDDAGKTEAGILASHAINTLAEQVADEIEGGAVIWPGTTPPTFHNLRLFEFKRDLLDRLFDEARKASNAANAFEKRKDSRRDKLIDLGKKGGAYLGQLFSDIAPGVGQVAGATFAGPTPMGAGVGAAVTGAGALLDSFAKLGSFFQTSYAYANVDVAGVDDTLFASAVAREMVMRRRNSDVAGTVLLPGRMATSDIPEKLSNSLDELSTARADSAQRLSTAEKRLSELALAVKAAESDAAKQIAEATEEKKPAEVIDTIRAELEATKASLGEVIAAYERAKAGETLAGTSYDDFQTSLATSTDDIPLIGRIIDEHTIKTMLENDVPLLYLHVHMQGGSNYTRKNLWSFLFGFHPFRVSGGVVASYFLVASDGTVRNSGNLSHHAGYRHIKDINQSAWSKMRSPIWARKSKLR